MRITCLDFISVPSDKKFRSSCVTIRVCTQHTSHKPCAGLVYVFYKHKCNFRYTIERVLLCTDVCTFGYFFKSQSNEIYTCFQLRHLRLLGK